ncbi:uncharacterized protein N7473_006994 [Penicillium subrubescens]|uniref:uncharacterized protein n=1 Tax=Penicillium subrubescens TaxID=1316194 RepID=UPI002545419F|nr:uncharacterized protein N7473_006994 [Penicillium subrubescens]KAJ5890766.1 hypothetical protein N7473_006994 [Penicillium subrubescens]
MSMPNSPQGSSTAGRPSWQEQLQEHCRRMKLPPPVFNIVSDRRGGRTAWSSNLTIQGEIISARYWYDGQYINNAKEDAAEVAVKKLNEQPRSSTVYPGQLYSQQSSAGYGRGAGGY